MPLDNSRQRPSHPLAVNRSLNNKAAHHTKRKTWKRLLRDPNLSLLWRQAEAVGG
jgi:hypothetical protein